MVAAMMADEGQVRARQGSQANQFALIVGKRKELRARSVSKLRVAASDVTFRDKWRDFFSANWRISVISVRYSGFSVTSVKNLRRLG